MKLKILTILLIIAFTGLSLSLINNYFGWYAYKKWTHRGGTTSISESKQRNVFIKQLEYKITDSENLYNFKFKPYFEKGFKYGVHTSDETRVIKFSSFPINLSFERNKNDSISLNIINKEKADSSDVVWTFFKNPKLKDTIRIEIDGARIKTEK